MPPLNYEGVWVQLSFTNDLIDIALIALIAALGMSVILMIGHFFRLLRR